MATHWVDNLVDCCRVSLHELSYSAYSTYNRIKWNEIIKEVGIEFKFDYGN